MTHCTLDLDATRHATLLATPQKQEYLLVNPEQHALEERAVQTLSAGDLEYIQSQCERQSSPVYR
jgi:hypothetical protein